MFAAIALTSAIQASAGSDCIRPLRDDEIIAELPRDAHRLTTAQLRATLVGRTLWMPGRMPPNLFDATYAFTLRPDGTVASWGGIEGPPGVHYALENNEVCMGKPNSSNAWCIALFGGQKGQLWMTTIDLDNPRRGFEPVLLPKAGVHECPASSR